MNLARILEASASLFPDRPAVIWGGRTYTYAWLDRRADAAAAALVSLGLRPGDLAALCRPASADWVALYYGILKAGAAAVTLFSGLTAPELRRHLADGRPVVLFLADGRSGDLGDRKALPFLKTVVAEDGDLPPGRFWDQGTAAGRALERDRDDTAAVLYTGGTTGTAKGVMLSHANILASAHHVAWAERSTPADRALCFLPLNHVFGQMHILQSTVLTGGAMVLLPGFDLEAVLAAIREHQVTKFYAVPTIYIRLLAQEGLREKLGPVRYTFSAAASMAREVVAEWRERTGLDIHEAYGLTESASMVTFNHYHRHVVGSVGTPVGTVEVTIRDGEGRVLEAGREGEICIRGPNIMRGYLGRDQETREAFFGDWFRSGDVGRLDEDHYLFLVDRIKDMIITGGENVYPREVEELLYERPEVQECSVVGLPDPEYGERVVAVILPRPGHKVDGAALKEFLKPRLAAFKRPKDFIVVDDLPKSPAGKTLKRELKKKLAEKD
ncbi:MAG: AMP-binding protein [Thermodesulfobacteriota bacterium]